MRPQILFPLFAPVQTLDKVGPRLSKLLARLGCLTVLDLLSLAPRHVICRSRVEQLGDVQAGTAIIAQITVIRHRAAVRRSLPHLVECRLGDEPLALVFFNHHSAWLLRTLPIQASRVIAGKLEYFRERAQIIHPDYIVAPDRQAHIPGIEPVYPAVAGLTSKMIASLIKAAGQRLPDLAEWLDTDLCKRQGWQSWKASMLALHQPEADGKPSRAALDRLAYDELLARQLALMMNRAHHQSRSGLALRAGGALFARLMEGLPFKLTRAQERAIAEIKADQQSPIRMLRMLQGDVGSGKTLVALAAMLLAVEDGRQAVLVAPTEVLVSQHRAVIAPMAERLGIELACLTSNETGKARRQMLQMLESGAARLILGTHALFQAGVQFCDLACVIVDEQHRFGVEQRLAIAAKGKQADMLVMSATPIPRTLAMVAFADLDHSYLDEKPKGRKPVKTLIAHEEKIEALIARIRERARDMQIFWV
ncbi:MAG: DEAD/DEAH box helicase, partial [Pseudomonadota bacterium]